MDEDRHRWHAARSVQVERPDEATACVCGHTAHWHGHGGAGSCEYNGECGCQAFTYPAEIHDACGRSFAEHDEDGQCPAAARLPVRPDEGKRAVPGYATGGNLEAARITDAQVEAAATCECCGKRTLEPITDPEEGIDFCPRCAIDGAVAAASEARPAVEGVTDAMVVKMLDELIDRDLIDTTHWEQQDVEAATELVAAALGAVLAGASATPETRKGLYRVSAKYGRPDGLGDNETAGSFAVALLAMRQEAEAGARMIVFSAATPETENTKPA